MKMDIVSRHLERERSVERRLNRYRQRNEKQRKITKKIKKHLVAAKNLVCALELCDSSNSDVSRQLQSATTFAPINTPSRSVFNSSGSILTSDRSESLNSTVSVFSPRFQSSQISIDDAPYITASMTMGISSISRDGCTLPNHMLESSVTSPSDRLNSKPVNRNSSNSSIEITYASQVNDDLIAESENSQRHNIDKTINDTIDCSRTLIRDAHFLQRSVIQTRDNLFTDPDLNLSNGFYQANQSFLGFAEETQKQTPNDMSQQQFNVESAHQSAQSGVPDGSIQAEDAINIVTGLPDDLNSQVSLSIQLSDWTLNDSYHRNYENIFNTPYMIGRVAVVAKNKQCDFSISEYMPQPQPNVLPTETQAETCMCCLCQLHLKCNVSHNFCIKIHPNEKSECRRGEPSKKNTQLKYQPRNICEECIESMILNTKKVKKSRKYRCCFDSCEKKDLTKSALKKHYLEHLGVEEYMCTICYKGIPTKSMVKRHERIH